MIERKIVDEKLQEYLVQDFISQTLSRVGHSHTEVQKTPVGEKILIHASRPGLIVGSKGANIKRLTKVLKSKFRFENPQIEIDEIKNVYVNATLIAENIAFQLERFGSQRFKGIGYVAMDNALKNGAMGIEILVSGKVPSSRARTWRFYMGYLKKNGDLAVEDVDLAYMQAKLKTGVIGIQVRVMPGNIVLPDTVMINKVETKVVEVTTQEDVTKQAQEEAVVVQTEPAPKKPRRKKTEDSKSQPKEVSE